ncbi:MAG TPA: homoserine O-acetyltransferase [Cyclobacteriaceae bacterium]|nr:homoserine O-acetyltransferase [Cyclobacteriaceae bacterium]
MEKTDHTFHYTQPFELESGKTLPGFQLRYTTLGKLNASRSNIVWVCHALTGSSDFSSWWSTLFTEDSPFNPNDHLILCANVLGGCYGSTGPLSINPQTHKPFYHSFPTLTNRDVVKAFDLLREHLGFDKIHTAIGASLGGQHVLQWAAERPDVFEHIIPIATNAFHSPWGIAFNEAQRLAIEADATWKDDDERAGLNGLKAARAIGMLSYRHYTGFAKAQAEKSNHTVHDFRAATYQRYQGEKLAKRFNAFTYRLLSRMMDSHHLGRGKESAEEALRAIRAKTLVISIDSDILFPPEEQAFLAAHIPDARLHTLSSLYGHDGFLVEYLELKQIIKNFYQSTLRNVFA